MEMKRAGGPRGPAHGESGQTTFEYILILTVVVAAYLIISKGLAAVGVGSALLSPIQKDFANAYKNGHPKALGLDDSGGPFKHPRATGPQSFRIFINPDAQAGGGGGDGG